jgi:hypothetical protein
VCLAVVVNVVVTAGAVKCCSYHCFMMRVLHDACTFYHVPRCICASGPPAALGAHPSQ